MSRPPRVRGRSITAAARDAGAKGSGRTGHGGGGMSLVSERGGRLWPGIVTGFDARCTCTWAPKDGVYQVKVADALCAAPGHARGSDG